MNLPAIQSLKSVLQTDEQYLWHAPLPALNKMPPVLPIFLSFIGGTVIFAESIPLGSRIACAALILLLAIVFLSAVKGNSEVLIVTDKRLLHFNKRFKLLKEFPIADVEFALVGEGACYIVARQGEYTTKWRLFTSAQHLSHLKGNLVALGRKA